MNSKGGRNGVPGLQPSLQDRVYDSNGIATACTTSPRDYIIDKVDGKPYPKSRSR